MLWDTNCFLEIKIALSKHLNLHIVDREIVYQHYFMSLASIKDQSYNWCEKEQDHLDLNKTIQLYMEQDTLKNVY